MADAPDLALRGLTLHVQDVEMSLAYYQRIPGAALLQHRPGEFALFQIGQFFLGMLNRKFLGPQGAPFHMEFSTAIADVDALYDAVRAAGIAVDRPPANRSWGERTFHATDPDGNMLEFDSRLGDR